MNRFLLLAVLLIGLQLRAQVIPNYKLTIAEADLDSMYAHGDEEIYFPAIFHVDNYNYNVEVRFKGSTSLLYPKKSWAIKFENNINIFNARRINLHTDYKDNSAMRNFLILNLFNHLGIDAPKVKHVTFEVNGEPYGLYTQVEQIDEDFLARNGKDLVAIYKARNHGGLMAPTVRDDYYRLIWEIEAGDDQHLNELRAYLNKCLYWTNNEFDANIESTVDINNFITFFAVHFVFVDVDNFTKNIFFGKNKITQKYEFIPWDNEGSFGNSALGIYDSVAVSYNLKDGNTPEYQVVLSRLLENPIYVSLFKTKVNEVLTTGYAYLDTLINSTHLRIKDNVFADTKKYGSNADFENSLAELKSFMAGRKLFLENNEIPTHYPLSNFYCSNPYPNPTNPNMVFRVNSPVPQRVRMFFADSVNFNRFGQNFKFSRIELYDDGEHNDMSANDLVYGNELNAFDFVSPLVPFTFTGAEQTYPQNGIFYIDYYGSKSFAINKGNASPNMAEKVQIGGVYEYNHRNFVQIINTSSSETVDLSYHHLRSDKSFNDFMFRDNVVLAPNEVIYIAANKDLGNHFFPNERSFFDLYYDISINDSLKLYSSVLTPIISTKVNELRILTPQRKNLVFNEINYKSSVEKPSGDWVEIYNPSDTIVDMTNWKFKDSKNSYNFPVGFKLHPNGYVVVAEDIVRFKTVHPSVLNVIGSSDIGLSSSGESLLLVDNIDQMIDSVYYKIYEPWPITAYGTGQTLELKSSILDNNIGENWFANTNYTGSPGAINNFINTVNNLQLIDIMVYPNPASDDLYIKSGSVELNVELTTIQGMTIQSTFVSSYSVKRLDISMLAQGIYLVKATGSGVSKTIKLIVK